MAEFVITQQMRAWANANGFNPDLHYEFFVDYIANKQGRPYKDIDAAFRNCLRADWGNLRRNSRIQQTYTKPAEYVHKVKGKHWVSSSMEREGHWEND